MLGPDRFGFLWLFGGSFEDFALAAVEHGLFTGDEVGIQKVGDAVVDGAVALFVTDFHQTDDLFEFALADAVTNSVVRS